MGIIYLVDLTGVSSEFFGENEFDIVLVDENEKYAANCIRLTKDTLLMPQGFPKTQAQITQAFADKGLSITILKLPMTEFEKADGGLTCL